MGVFRRHELFFFTATILKWKHLLKPIKYKNIIINSLGFLVSQHRVVIHAFVIMDNHLHIIWQIIAPNSREAVQRDFLKYTAQMIKFDLIDHHPEVLSYFKVNAKDRAYQFWERNSLSVNIWTEAVLIQKLNYIHENPVRAGIIDKATDYWYSSTKFYETGVDDFGFLTFY